MFCGTWCFLCQHFTKNVLVWPRNKPADSINPSLCFLHLLSYQREVASVEMWLLGAAVKPLQFRGQIVSFVHLEVYAEKKMHWLKHLIKPHWSNQAFTFTSFHILFWANVKLISLLSFMCNKMYHRVSLKMKTQERGSEQHETQTHQSCIPCTAVNWRSQHVSLICVPSACILLLSEYASCSFWMWPSSVSGDFT